MMLGQVPEVTVSGMRGALGILPLNTGQSQTGVGQSRAEEGVGGVHRALDIQLDLDGALETPRSTGPALQAWGKGLTSGKWGG